MRPAVFVLLSLVWNRFTEVSYRMASQSSLPAFTQKTIFQHKPFRTIWLAQFVSIFGDFLALFGVISLITFKLHGTAVQVTAVTIAYVLPLAVISPVAGVFVDHWNVKRVMIASDLMRALLITILIFVTDIDQICAIFALLSAVSSFFAPAQSVTLRTVVPMQGLLAANAMITQAFYIVRLFSPFAAGALIAVMGERICFWLDTTSFLFSAAMISTLVILRPARANAEKTVQALTQDFVTGNKFIFSHAGLAFVFLAMAVAMFVLSSFSPLISIYIRDSLGAGPFLFGVISSMVGIGLIAGSQVLTRLGAKTSTSEQNTAAHECSAGRTIRARSGSSAAGRLSQRDYGRFQHLHNGFCNLVCFGAGADHVAAGDSARDGRTGEQHLHVIDLSRAGAGFAALRILG